MHFDVKSYLKSTRNHTDKHARTGQLGSWSVIKSLVRERSHVAGVFFGLLAGFSLHDEER